jgi:hypothetical protein
MPTIQIITFVGIRQGLKLRCSDTSCLKFEMLKLSETSFVPGGYPLAKGGGGLTYASSPPAPACNLDAPNMYYVVFLKLWSLSARACRPCNATLTRGHGGTTLAMPQNKCDFCVVQVLLVAVLRRAVPYRFVQASERLRKELLALAALLPRGWDVILHCE